MVVGARRRTSRRATGSALRRPRGDEEQQPREPDDEARHEDDRSGRTAEEAWPEAEQDGIRDDKRADDGLTAKGPHDSSSLLRDPRAHVSTPT
jgi:hypothetical protein